MRLAPALVVIALPFGIAATAQELLLPNQIGTEGGSIPESLVIEAEEHNTNFKADISGFGLGRELLPGEVDSWDIDVRFDGVGLPQGSGDVATGEVLYEAQCAACHGAFGEGEGRWPPLSGGEDSLTHQGEQRPEKTVGSYWPYAPSLYDYIRRAMPYNSPQSLSADETYAIVAYILTLNDLADDDFVADADSLSEVKMPNADNFFDDPRPDVQNTACMSDCLDPDKLELVEAVRGITPLQHLESGSGGETTQASLVTHPDGTGQNKLYDASCAVCHINGVGGAPLLGAPDWKDRLAQAGGFDGLVQSVLTGKNAMPPRGTAPADVSDEEIAEAVLHMLTVSGISP